MSETDRLDRRTVLKSLAGTALVGTLAGCSSSADGSASADAEGEAGDDSSSGDGSTETATPTATPTESDDSGSSGGSGDADFGGWFDNVSNFDGVVDRTGQAEVSVTVGTEANGGGYGFGPAAIAVSPGTTVTWEWNGEGGSHNVVAEDGSFQSEIVAEAGFTFSHTFEETGTYEYLCQPHATLGMKGAVVVE